MQSLKMVLEFVTLSTHTKNRIQDNRYEMPCDMLEPQSLKQTALQTPVQSPKNIDGFVFFSDLTECMILKQFTCSSSLKVTLSFINFSVTMISFHCSLETGTKRVSGNYQRTILKAYMQTDICFFQTKHISSLDCAFNTTQVSVLSSVYPQAAPLTHTHFLTVPSQIFLLPPSGNLMCRHFLKNGQLNRRAEGNPLNSQL